MTVRAAVVADDVAREFLDSSFGSDLRCVDGRLSVRLTAYLQSRQLGRIAADRDAYDLVLNSVIGVLAGRTMRRG